MTKLLLLSKDNPEGQTLESVLKQLQDELMDKVHKVDSNHPYAKQIKSGTNEIVSLLGKAHDVQSRVIELLSIQDIDDEIESS